MPTTRPRTASRTLTHNAVCTHGYTGTDATVDVRTGPLFVHTPVTSRDAPAVSLSVKGPVPKYSAMLGKSLLCVTMSVALSRTAALTATTTLSHGVPEGIPYVGMSVAAFTVRSMNTFRNPATVSLRNSSAVGFPVCPAPCCVPFTGIASEELTEPVDSGVTGGENEADDPVAEVAQLDSHLRQMGIRDLSTSDREVLYGDRWC